jgi:phosphoenolpyruvate carboxylase
MPAGRRVIRHPRELRAIPNNAILQQLGWLANSVHGIGQAAARAPELFSSMRESSERFGRAYRLAAHAMANSDLDVLRAYLDTLDAGSWFDRARRTEKGGAARRTARRRRGAGAARSRPGAAAAVLALRLRPAEAEGGGWRAAGDAGPAGGAAHAAPGAAAPDLAPRDAYPGFPAACRGDARTAAGAYPQARTWPARSRCSARSSRSTPTRRSVSISASHRGPREGGAYAAFHRDVVEPMRECFSLLREISGAIQHEIGAFG